MTADPTSLRPTSLRPTSMPQALLAWHDPDRRRLPWRTTSDPYGVLVSEIMAQQTQAERAGVAWQAFLRRFPRIQDLAAAPRGDVIQAWQGLGYNRRAVNLHRCAQQVVDHHGGALPPDLDALLALPGVGPYTARAVLAFGFGADSIGVDTNVARVLARTTGRVLTRPEAQHMADRLAAGGRGPALAAALMDLGASTCTARSPSCQPCPLLASCAWSGGPEADPAAAGAHRPRPQGTFIGSARQARGRLVDAMRSGPVAPDRALSLAGAHGHQLLDALVAEGLAEATAEGFGLPGWAGRPG